MLCYDNSCLLAILLSGISCIRSIQEEVDAFVTRFAILKATSCCYEFPHLMKNPHTGTWIAERIFLSESSATLAQRFHLPTLQKASKRLLVGRLEWLSLPALRLSPWLAKTDTGARTSCLHATDVSLDADGKMVHFVTTGDDGQALSCCAKLSRIKSIRNSSGVASQRFIISTNVELPGGLRFAMEFSLADRRHMKCPILLGRRALAGHFLVDPQSQFLLGSFPSSPHSSIHPLL